MFIDFSKFKMIKQIEVMVAEGAQNKKNTFELNVTRDETLLISCAFFIGVDWISYGVTNAFTLNLYSSRVTSRAYGHGGVFEEFAICTMYMWH